MDDLISRKATIDAMEGVDWYHINKDGKLTHGANSDDYEPLYKAEDVYKVLNDMPSAQPETHDKRTETHACDLISRQDAINILDAYQVMVENGEENPYTWARFRMSELPSAQPEIIKCKDCKWCKDADGLMCKNPASWVVATECDFGCVLAERRTDDSD